MYNEKGGVYMYLIFDLDDTLLTTDKVITRYTKSVLIIMILIISNL